MLNMFRMLIHPSTGACDLFVELFHGLYCSGSMCVGVTLWFGWGGVVSVCRLKLQLQPAYGYHTKHETRKYVDRMKGCSTTLELGTDTNVETV